MPKFVSFNASRINNTTIGGAGPAMTHFINADAVAAVYLLRPGVTNLLTTATVEYQIQEDVNAVIKQLNAAT